MVATSLFFCLEMLRHLRQAEQQLWTDYIDLALCSVRTKFNVDLSNHIGTLHAPLARISKVHDRTFRDLNTHEHLDVLALLSFVELPFHFKPDTGRSPNSKKLEILKQLILNGRDHAQWPSRSVLRDPTCVPSALAAVDVGTDELTMVGEAAPVRKPYNFPCVMLIFQSCVALLAGFDELKHAFQVVGIQNKFINPSPVGLRMLVAIIEVQAPDGHFLAEIQLHHIRYVQAWKEVHATRSLLMDKLAWMAAECAADPDSAGEICNFMASLMATMCPRCCTAPTSVFSINCGKYQPDEIPEGPGSFVEWMGVTTRYKSKPSAGLGQLLLLDFAEEHSVTSSLGAREVFVTAEETEEDSILSPESHKLQLQAYCAAAKNVCEADNMFAEAEDMPADEKLLSSGIFFYDVQWLLELQQSSVTLAMQDCLVLVKMLVASVALFSVTRASELLRCDGLAFEATQAVACLNTGDNTMHWQYERKLEQLPSSIVQSNCKPTIDLTALDNSFIALIGANQMLFVVFMCLRHAAYWKPALIPPVLRVNSLKVALVFTAASALLALLKITIAISYTHTTISYGNKQPVVPLLHLSNCSEVNVLDSRNSTATKHGDGFCSIAIPCNEQCHLQTPGSLKSLCCIYGMAR
jgi:hypothetical protein